MSFYAFWSYQESASTSTSFTKISITVSSQLNLRPQIIIIGTNSVSVGEMNITMLTLKGNHSEEN